MLLMLKIQQTYVNQYVHLLMLNFLNFNIILREFKIFIQFYFLLINLEKLKNPYYYNINYFIKSLELFKIHCWFTNCIKFIIYNNRFM